MIEPRPIPAGSATPPLPGQPPDLPALPGWLSSAAPQSAEMAGFRAGVALAVLDALVADPAVPVGLLASRLALDAAGATARLEGRVVSAGTLRDAYHLAPPGTARGPEGD
ncbi:MAG: DUF1403 family protein, partial [Pseudomonadota bacterium]